MSGMKKSDDWHDKQKNRFIAELVRHHGCVRQAAKNCGISRRTAYLWIERYKINLDKYRKAM